MSSNGIANATNMFGRYGPIAAGAVILLVLAVAGLSRVGCANHHTPPGHAGYVRSKPLAGAGEFVGTQIGPTSTGWVWRQEVVNIDIRPRTYSEDMSIPTRNQGLIELRAHARIRPRQTMESGRDPFKELVEQFGGENWYAANVRDQFRSSVRDKVQKLEPFEVKDSMRTIGDEVLTDMQKRYDDKPIEFLSVDVGDIQYPKEVVDAVIRKRVTNEDNKRAEIQAQIAREQILIGSAEAEGIAKAQEIIRQTLDPMFLQFEALRAIEKLSESKNSTFLIMPFSDKNSTPIIVNMDK